MIRISKSLKSIDERAKKLSSDMHLVGAQFERLSRLLSEAQNESP
jgi:hypothetical protein